MSAVLSCPRRISAWFLRTERGLHGSEASTVFERSKSELDCLSSPSFLTVIVQHFRGNDTISSCEARAAAPEWQQHCSGEIGAGNQLECTQLAVAERDGQTSTPSFASILCRWYQEQMLLHLSRMRRLLSVATLQFASNPIPFASQPLQKLRFTA